MAAVLPLVQVAAVGGLVALATAPGVARGSGLSLVAVAGAALLAAWALVPVHAWRRARRRRVRLDLPSGDTSAVDLLWLAPAAIALWAVAWGVGGRAADPATVVASYVADWGAGRAGSAAARFVDGPPPAAVDAIWQQQVAALRNELVRLAPADPAAAAIDPDRPLALLRWVEQPADPDSAGGRRLVTIEAARRETVRDLVLGFVPITSQRLVAVARLGTVELRAVPAAGPFVEWRIDRIEVAGVTLGG